MASFENVVNESISYFENRSYLELSGSISQISQFIFDERKISLESFLESELSKVILSLFQTQLPEGLIHELCILLTNISAEKNGDSSYIETLQRYNLPRKCVEVLTTQTSQLLQEDCLCILINISADSIRFRDLILRELDVVPKISTLLSGKAFTEKFWLRVLFLCRNLICQKGLNRGGNHMFKKNLNLILIIAHLQQKLCLTPIVSELCLESLSCFCKHYHHLKQRQEVWDIYLKNGPPLDKLLNIFGEYPSSPALSYFFAFISKIMTTSIECYQKLVNEGLLELYKRLFRVDNVMVLNLALKNFTDLIKFQKGEFIPLLLNPENQIILDQLQNLQQLSDANVISNVIDCIGSILECSTENECQVLQEIFKLKDNSSLKVSNRLQLFFPKK